MEKTRLPESGAAMSSRPTAVVTAQAVKTHIGRAREPGSPVHEPALTDDEAFNLVMAAGTGDIDLEQIADRLNAQRKP